MWGDFFSLIYCHYCHSKYNCLIIIDLSVAIRAFSIVTYCHLLPRLAFAYSFVSFLESGSCLIHDIKTGISFSMIFQSCLGFIV